MCRQKQVLLESLALHNPQLISCDHTTHRIRFLAYDLNILVQQHHLRHLCAEIFGGTKGYSVGSESI